MRNYIICIIACICITSCKRDVVDIKVTADFAYEIADNNYSVPVRIAFKNKSTHAQLYKWTFEGGTPATYDKEDPGVVTFIAAGSIKVKLEAWSDLGKDEKEITIILDSVPKAAFIVTPVVNNYGITDFMVTNTSGGGITKFNWSFMGASPLSSTQKNPGNIRITQPGQYRIFLEAMNDRGRKDTLSKYVTVLPALSAAFTIVPSFDDDDNEAPLLATLQNSSISVTKHNWSAPGGIIAAPTDSLPTVQFNAPGNYTVTYTAGNGKDSATVSQTIVVKPNTGLRTFSNVKLGINTAQSTVGNYFSTMLHKVILKNEVDESNGNKIDIIFYGLSQSFNYNLFISPLDVQAWAFTAIPNAQNTKVINTQELCNCGVNFTATDFNNVINGNAFNGIQIIETPGGTKEFDDALVPRVVLFENYKGKKGAIKIKQVINDGLNSYILCDIKVQKD